MDTATKLKICVSITKKIQIYCRFKSTFTNRFKKKAGKSRERRHRVTFKKGQWNHEKLGCAKTKGLFVHKRSQNPAKFGLLLIWNSP